MIDHPCQTCGKPGMFGYEVNLIKGKLGRWFCWDHRPCDVVDKKIESEKQTELF